jgi:hypothetical protein
MIFHCYQFDIPCYKRVILAIYCYTQYVQNLRLSTNKREINPLDVSSDHSYSVGFIKYFAPLEELNSYIDA